jgi:hypothetical protein
VLEIQPRTYSIVWIVCGGAVSALAACSWTRVLPFLKPPYTHRISLVTLPTCTGSLVGKFLRGVRAGRRACGRTDGQAGVQGRAWCTISSSKLKGSLPCPARAPRPSETPQA